MPVYIPTPPPQNPEGISQFLDDELNRLSDAVNETDVFTQEQLRNANAVCNRGLKRTGLQVWDSTNGKPVWASGRMPTSPWVNFEGVSQHSPV